MFNINEIRKDFPIFDKLINGKRNTFLDTAASAQKPQKVVDAMLNAYMNEYANVHRGSYWLSEKMTELYEVSRKSISSFLNAKSSNEIIFTRNATEGINLIAASWGNANLSKGDEILISKAEHHANLVPWQQLALRTGAILKYFDLNEDGSFSLDYFQNAISEKTKLIAVTAMSNVLGTIFPIKLICDIAHRFGAIVLVDACQYIVHKKVDVQNCDCDFLVFSGHKLYGPTGIGVLYGKYDLLCDMPPYQFGGDMIEKVEYYKTTFALPPARFEAGTPAIVQAIGLKAAIDYIAQFDFNEIEKHEKELIHYTTNALDQIEGVKIYGRALDKGGVFSFSIKDIHPQDLAFILNKEGIAIRTGHFCAEPLVTSLGHSSLSRVSLGLYSSKEDIDIFINALYKAKKFLI